MNYRTLLIRHLVSYRRSELLINECGIYRYRGRAVPCEHVLPARAVWRNVLPAALESSQTFLAKNPKKRHRYFHHLNSSQAFAFNLFFPYFDGGPEAASALLRALGQGGTLRAWEPEAVLDPEEKTNLDATWLTSDGIRTFCEVKLSESDLGRASDDKHHRRKLRKTYRQVLAGHIRAELLEPSQFFRSYQFLRNVWYLAQAENGRLLFLVPRANTSIWGALSTVIPLVHQPLRSRISLVPIESVLAGLQADSTLQPDLRAHAIDLERKYVPAGGDGNDTRSGGQL